MKNQSISLTYCVLTIVFLVMMVMNAKSAIVFSKAGSPYHITEDYVVSNGDTLIFESGSTLILSPSTNIITNGVIIIKGLPDDHVSFLPEVDKVGWGIIDINCPEKASIFEYVDIVDGRIYSRYCDVIADNLKFYNNQPLVWHNALLYIMRASGKIINSAIYGSYKGEGFLLNYSESAIVRNCYMNKIPDAVEFINITGGQISNNVFEDIPDDAIDLNNCTNTIIDSNVIVNVADRGMEIGSEDFGSSENITVTKNVIVGCKQGVTFKENSYGQVINNTFHSNRVGIKCIEDNSPRSGSYIDVSSCIFSNSTENDIVVDPNSAVSLSYCLSDNEMLPGAGNILGNPLFENADNNKFNLTEDSPCINAGNPAFPLDPDNTINDIGAYYFNTDTTATTENICLFDALNLFPNPFISKFSITTSTHINNIELFTLNGKNIPFVTEEDKRGALGIYQISPAPVLKPNQVIVCKVSIGNGSKSYLLLRRYN